MPRIKPKPILVPRADAAVLLGLSSETLRDWAAATPPAGPPAIKLTSGRQGRVYYRMADLERFAADPAAFGSSRSPRGRA